MLMLYVTNNIYSGQVWSTVLWLVSLQMSLSVHDHNVWNYSLNLHQLFWMFLIAMAQILLLQCYDTIRTSGFMEDIMFTQNSQEHKHTHPFNGPFSGATWVRRYQKGKTNLDFTEARDSEWQWHQLGHMQVCILLQTDNHTSPPPPICFYRPDALPATQPTASKHWRQNGQEQVMWIRGILKVTQQRSAQNWQQSKYSNWFIRG